MENVKIYTHQLCNIIYDKKFTNGIIRNWQKNPIAGPIGFFNESRHTSQSIAQPKLIYKMDTSIATLAVNMISIVRSSRTTMIRETSWLSLI